MRKSDLHAVVPIQSRAPDSSLHEPKRPYLNALNELQQTIGGPIQALFNYFGHVRSISTDSQQGLCRQKIKGNCRLQARSFLNQKAISNALALRYAELVYNGETEIGALGKRIEFKQVVKLSKHGKVYPVRGGFVHVFVSNDGTVFQVNSTVRHGRKPKQLGKIVSSEAAIIRAKASVEPNSEYWHEYKVERVELTFSAHGTRLEPVYEVVLSTFEPKKVFLTLVKGKSGKVVYRENKLRTVKRRSAVADKTVKGNSFLRIPDPNVDLLSQIHEVVLESLPDPKVLKNDNLIVYLGNKKKEVRAKADGTFLYKPNDPEFAAVLTFFAFHSQMELMKSWGMIAPEKPIPVYVDDPDVSDNAYFDPETYDIHLGEGSGAPFGLAEHIAYDLGVTWHENGHHIVYLQTPGKDLPGSQGGGIHESIGDVLGNLLMDFWFRDKYGTELGHTLTVKDIEDDPLIIGAYASPPNGIRIQKNNARTPNDETGEPHDDGLISGGAKADLLVEMVKQASGEIKDVLKTFGTLTLAALALVPAHKVTFEDLLQAYLSADKQLNNSANKQTILDAFAGHGIKQQKFVGSGIVPVIIIQQWSR
jgi:Zn-dependent metalloprotease